MYLIVGLGNPGSRYVSTRHNIGFRVTEALARSRGEKFKKKLFCNARECSLKISRHKVLVVQPLAFMNLSGGIVLKYAKGLKVQPGNILIVYDDIDLPLGSLRYKDKGSSGGHNGIGSIIQCLGTDNIPRLRMGINNGQKPRDLSEYVLSDFEEDELPGAKEAIDKAVLECERWVLQGS